MNWKLQESSASVSEYILTSASGHQVSFKYSHLQYSLRIRYNEHHAVYLLDRHNFAGRKFVVKNVYGTEIGVVSKTFLRSNSGTIHFHEHKPLKYTIYPDQLSFEILQYDSSISCTLDERSAQHQQDIYLLAIIVLAWAETKELVKGNPVSNATAKTK